jgi:hypothetical protein
MASVSPGWARCRLGQWHPVIGMGAAARLQDFGPAVREDSCRSSLAPNSARDNRCQC